MIWRFSIQPDFRLLNKYGYTNLSVDELAAAENNRQGVVYEAEFRTEGARQEDFVAAFVTLAEDYELIEHVQTILYLTLLEHDQYLRILFHAYDVYESKKLAKELAQFVLCLHQTPESKLMGLKLTTNTESVKVADKKLITWIGKLVRQGLEQGNFSWEELGEGVYQLLDSGTAGIKFGEPLNYEKIASIADRTVRSPNTIVKKQLARFLHTIWYFIDNETSLTRDCNVRYADRQLNFLFKLGEVFGCLNELTIESEPKDYIRTLFENYIRL